MNALVFSFVAAGCTAIANLFFRKNSDSKKNNSSSNFLVLFYLSSFILSVIVFPDLWKTPVNIFILLIGVIVGILSSTLMLLQARALQKGGPAGITFAFSYASAVFPGIILFLLLGPAFGFSCTFVQIGGMVLVLLGLFIGTRSSEPVHYSKNTFAWIKYAVAGFLVQILALTFIQGRCVLFEMGETNGLFSFLSSSTRDDVWFMPGQFAASFLMQAGIHLYENKKFTFDEIKFGSFGGVVNFLSTLSLVLATKFALPFEKSILFPCFAVASMILCNIWANRLYGERFNISSNLICSAGIFLAVYH